MSLEEAATRAAAWSAATDLPSLEGYEVQRQIGRGGSATVYLAREVKHDRLVAIKVLHPVLAASLQSERFLREIGVIAKLAHPNILPLLDSGRNGDLLYYVMPYVPGESLRSRMQREQRLPIDEAVRITRETAEALDYAHRQGLVHRDVKPENILLADGHALVADFGIARAMRVATDDRLTLGLAPGTPRYMSPEQSSGETPVDGRSDIYSLGCVLYELLSGSPPFTGETPEDVRARHAVASPPSLKGSQVAVPPALQSALRVALAKRPRDRFSTAAEFAAALEGGVSGWPWRREWGGLGRALRRAPVWSALVAGGVVVLWAVSRPGGTGRISTATPDTTRLVVFPRGDGAQGQGQLQEDVLLSEAIAKWSGVTLVDQFQVAEALARLNGQLSVASAKGLAMSLGAGRFILLRVTPFGDSKSVQASLYDVEGDRPPNAAAETIPNERATAIPGFERLSQKLLFRGAPADSLLVMTRGSTSLPAVQAFGRAHQSLSRWDLGDSDSLFQVALTYDPNYARANLWSAQVRAWQGKPADAWSVLAERASANAAFLTAREGLLTTALVQLARGEYAAACSQYDQLRRRNDNDFGAWYGLGECRSRDRAVVRDASSPTGWRMRSNYGAAVRAYDRALELLPSSYAGYEHDAFSGLRPLLLVRTSLIPGSAAKPDTGQFLARLALLGDSLVLLPYPWQVAMAGGAESVPPGLSEAEALRTREFRKLAAAWSAAFPNRAGPKQAVAIALEMLGDHRAVDTLALARRLATDAEVTVRLVASEALLRAKFADPEMGDAWRRVRVLADSILDSQVADPLAANALISLAALTGRCDVSEQLSGLSKATESTPIPSHLVRAVQLHLARAALGCSPGRTGISLQALVKSRDQARVSRDMGPFTDVVVLSRPVLHDWPPDSALVERLAASSKDLPLAGPLRAWVRRDTAAALAGLTASRARWHEAFGPQSPDVALPTARLFAAVGDTTEAITVLDQTLDGLRSYDPWRMGDPVVVASLVRAMALRADLANARGDIKSARQWSRIVAALWSGADEELQPLVRRMTRYASRR